MPKQRWLNGWDKIAQYIDTCVDTAKRYHTEYNMPIHWSPTKRPRALPDQLDKWFMTFKKKQS